MPDKKAIYQKLRQVRYVLLHDVFNRHNILLIVAIVVALIWLSSAVQAISRNHDQQKRLDIKTREAKILALQTENLAYEQDYYRSQEYQDLALRQKTNLVLPGEKVIILPESSAWVAEKEAEISKKTSSEPQPEPSNFRKWLDFFFGAKSASINSN